MPTIERAKHIQKMMSGNRQVYWDNRYDCFRVMSMMSRSLSKKGDENRYTLVEKL